LLRARRNNITGYAEVKAACCGLGDNKAIELRVPGQDGPRLLGPRPPDGDHRAEAHSRRLRRIGAIGLADQREAALCRVVDCCSFVEFTLSNYHKSLIFNLQL